jgi:hypothetical protein
VDPGKAPLARASQTCGASPTRHGAFHAGTAIIRRLKRLWRFPVPGHLAGLILRLGPDGARPPGVALRGAYTLGSWVAVPTIRGRARHLDDRMATVIHGRRPPSAGRAGRAGGVWLAPLNLAVLGVNAGPGAGWPVIVQAGGPQQIHAIGVATLDEEVGVQATRVHDRGAGQEAPLRPCGVDLGRRRASGRRADGGVNVREQGRQVIGADFRERHCVAAPRRGVLTGILRVKVMR